METGAGRNASQQAIDSMDEIKEALGGEERDRKLVSREGKLESREGSGEKSETRSTRKRKHMSENVDSAGTVSPACSPTAHKMKTRKRK